VSLTETVKPNGTPETRKPSRLAELLKTVKSIGPGLVTGASDDDPSGIATYSLAGAVYGYSMLWTATLFFPLMSSVEYICAKIGMVSGTGLAGAMREHYSKKLVFLCVSLLVIANTINVGTDIGAIAAAGNMLFPSIPALTIVPAVVAAVLLMQIFGNYKIISTLFKTFTLSLLSYFLCTLFIKLDVPTIIRSTFVPNLKFDTAHLTMIVALLGTTISPYCFFWQASQEVEEEMKLGRRTVAERLGATRRELRDAVLDVDLGMFISVLVMYFIMVTTAATLHAAGHTQINSAADAARALRPLAGENASLIFAAGIIGTGFLAIPVLTDSAAYAVAELFGFAPSLDEKPSQEKIFYFVIIASTLIGMTINFLGINAMDALFITAVINGLLSPPLLFAIMRISNNREIMGDRVNCLLTNVLGWTTVVLTSTACFLLIWFMLCDFANKAPFPPVR
jgi:NRAMP (natural resistance-associated macrophage protein)-like metal ion transporter